MLFFPVNLPDFFFLSFISLNFHFLRISSFIIIIIIILFFFFFWGEGIMPPPDTPTRGGSRIFIFRGAQRIIVAARTLRTEKPNSLSAGV